MMVMLLLLLLETAIYPSGSRHANITYSSSRDHMLVTNVAQDSALSPNESVLCLRSLLRPSFIIIIMRHAPAPLPEDSVIFAAVASVWIILFGPETKDLA